MGAGHGHRHRYIISIRCYFNVVQHGLQGDEENNMPVVGTPIAPISSPDPVAAPAEAVCQDQNQLTPEVSRYYGNLVLSRMRSVKGHAGQQMEINWTMLDSHGHAVDLRECGFVDAVADPSSSSEASSVSSSVSSVSASPSSPSSSSAASVGSAAAPPVLLRFRIRENLSIGEQPVPSRTSFPVTVVDAEQGQVKVTLPSQATGLPGVYFGEFAVLNDDEVIIFTNVLYILIDRGQFGAFHSGGPPTIAEIRLHLRASAAEESLLLDNMRFDDAEIALAISRPIEYWNEIPPPIYPRYSTQNFPWRFHWLEAICANLFFMLEEQFRANNLTYSAAGVQVNDQDKEPNYARAGERRWANWVEFVKRQKSSINLEGAYGGIGSGYGYSYNATGHW